LLFFSIENSIDEHWNYLLSFCGNKQKEQRRERAHSLIVGEVRISVEVMLVALFLNNFGGSIFPFRVDFQVSLEEDVLEEQVFISKVTGDRS
jgi:hypothetical protein